MSFSSISCSLEFSRLFVGRFCIFVCFLFNHLESSSIFLFILRLRFSSIWCARNADIADEKWLECKIWHKVVDFMWNVFFFSSLHFFFIVHFSVIPCVCVSFVWLRFIFRRSIANRKKKKREIKSIQSVAVQSLRCRSSQTHRKIRMTNVFATFASSTYKSIGWQNGYLLLFSMWSNIYEYIGIMKLQNRNPFEPDMRVHHRNICIWRMVYVVGS